MRKSALQVTYCNCPKTKCWYLFCYTIITNVQLLYGNWLLMPFAALPLSSVCIINVKLSSAMIGWSALVVVLPRSTAVHWRSSSPVNWPPSQLGRRQSDGFCTRLDTTTDQSYQGTNFTSPTNQPTNRSINQSINQKTHKRVIGTKRRTLEAIMRSPCAVYQTVQSLIFAYMYQQTNIGDICRRRHIKRRRDLSATSRPVVGRHFWRSTNHCKLYRGQPRPSAYHALDRKQYSDVFWSTGRRQKFLLNYICQRQISESVNRCKTHTALTLT